MNNDSVEAKEGVHPESSKRCPNCGHAMSGAWCSECGQEYPFVGGAVARVVARQWTRIRHSLVALLLRPGQLTAEFRDGQRARSINPWRLTFNIIGIFLALSFVTEFKVASFPKFEPTGTLSQMLNDAANAAHLERDAFLERVDRRFNTIYTILLTLTIALTALGSRLTHWKVRPWSLHAVFALHLTAWGFIVNLVYTLALRAFGVAAYLTSNDVQVRVGGAAVVTLIVLWEWSYVTFAFRRVFADGRGAAIGKAAVMTVLRFVVGNLVVSIAFLLAMRSVSG